MKIPVPNTLVRLTGLRALERYTTFAAAKKSEQKQMECVRLEIAPNSVQAVACDGSRLIETREKVEKAKTEDTAKEKPKKKTSKTKKTAAKAA